MSISLDVVAIFLSVIALIATGYNIYLQYFKVEIVCYTEMADENFYVIIENPSSNLAHNYTIQIEKVVAPQEVTTRFFEMPLLNGKVPFNLSPKKHMTFYIATYLDAYVEDRDTYPTFTLKIFDSKRRIKGAFDIDFNMYYHKATTYGEGYYLRQELKSGFESLEKAIKTK